jgi:hypothetical protein
MLAGLCIDRLIKGKGRTVADRVGLKLRYPRAYHAATDEDAPAVGHDMHVEPPPGQEPFCRLGKRPRARCVEDDELCAGPEPRVRERFSGRKDPPRRSAAIGAYSTSIHCRVAAT